MSPAETPLPGSRRRRERDASSSPEVELALPTALRHWLPALTLWSVIDEPRYRLVSRSLGDGSGGDWAAFVATAAAAGLLEEGPSAGSWVFRPDWAGTLELARQQLGGRDDLRSRLLDAWLAQPDPALVSDIARWANDLRRWDVVEETWLAANGSTSGVAGDVLEIYGDLPTEARRERPLLTFASAAAASVLASSSAKQGGVGVQRLLLDSVALHSDWSTRADTDAAVAAGSFRMVGERRMPATVPGQALEAAWRTKQEVDALIDARSREGRPPTRRTHAIFRVFSARLALARADSSAAVDEARWASILADWEPVQVISRGLELLAASVLHESGPTSAGRPRLAAIDEESGIHGLLWLGETYEVLADLHQAVRSLDRPEVERTLALVSPESAAMAGYWSIRASAEAFHAGLWGDAEEGLVRLLEEISRESMLGREQDEPLGGLLLARAQLMLLKKAGAFGAAGRVADLLPEPARLLPQARIHLWSGHFREAVQLADAGTHREGLPLSERRKLALIKAGAALLAGTPDHDVVADATRALRAMLAEENFMPIGTLPEPARDALLEACGPALLDEPNFELLKARLERLGDAGEQGPRAVRLTDREKLLLPLLATDDSVPEIARKLQVSVNTVRKQVVTLREKFQAESRSELVRKATAYGAI